MQNSFNLSPEGRNFLIERAKNARASGQPILLETNTQHSTYTGRIIDVTEGGVDFAADTGIKLSLPWESVAYLGLCSVGQPAGFNAAETNTNRRTVGAGVGSNQ